MKKHNEFMRKVLEKFIQHWRRWFRWAEESKLGLLEVAGPRWSHSSWFLLDWRTKGRLWSQHRRWAAGRSWSWCHSRCRHTGWRRYLIQSLTIWGFAFLALWTCLTVADRPPARRLYCRALAHLRIMALAMAVWRQSFPHRLCFQPS